MSDTLTIILAFGGIIGVAFIIFAAAVVLRYRMDYRDPNGPPPPHKDAKP